MTTTYVPFKVRLGEDVHRFSLRGPLSISDLHRRVEDTFQVSQGQLSLKYVDEDKDLITLSTVEDLRELLRLHSRHGSISEKPIVLLAQPNKQSVRCQFAQHAQDRRQPAQLQRTRLHPAQRQPDTPGTSAAVHFGIQCDGCGASPIVGPRFHSLERRDFDLCANCIPRAQGESWQLVPPQRQGPQRQQARRAPRTQESAPFEHFISSILDAVAVNEAAVVDKIAKAEASKKDTAAKVAHAAASAARGRRCQRQRAREERHPLEHFLASIGEAMTQVVQEQQQQQQQQEQQPKQPKQQAEKKAEQKPEQTSSLDASNPSSWSVGKLKRTLAAHNVDTSNIIEKFELVSLARELQRAHGLTPDDASVSTVDTAESHPASPLARSPLPASPLPAPAVNETTVNETAVAVAEAEGEEAADDTIVVDSGDEVGDDSAEVDGDDNEGDDNEGDDNEGDDNDVDADSVDVVTPPASSSPTATSSFPVIEKAKALAALGDMGFAPDLAAAALETNDWDAPRAAIAIAQTKQPEVLLAQLRELGFGDERANLAAILATRGNLTAAVERLLA